MKSFMTLIFVFGIFSCQNRHVFKSVELQEFKTEIEKPGVQLLDVRTPKEFAEGHIPGAMNIDVNASDFDENIATLDKERGVAVYCRSGRRSKVAANKLANAGFKVTELNSGFLSWDGNVEK